MGNWRAIVRHAQDVRVIYRWATTDRIGKREAAPMGEVQATIEAALRAKLAPTHLEVINESHMHSVPKGSETHFKVVVISPGFEGLSLIKVRNPRAGIPLA